MRDACRIRDGRRPGELFRRIGVVRERLQLHDETAGSGPGLQAFENMPGELGAA